MADTLLITGGAGFIGSHLADDALAHGDRVVVLDNLSTGKRENVPAGATFYQRDISDPGLDELVRDEKIDVVSHHAAQVNVRISIADPTADARTNILATLDLIAACKKAGVRRFLFASSGGTVYGEQKVYPCDEEHSLHPTSPYGCAKLAVELYLDAFRVHGRPRPDRLPLRQHLRPAPGAERARPGSSRSSPRSFSPATSRESSTTASRRATTSTSATWWGAPRRARPTGRRGPTTSARGPKPPSTPCTTWSPASWARRSARATSRRCSAELRRNSLDAGRLERALGAAPKTRIAEGLALTLPYYQGRAAALKAK